MTEEIFLHDKQFIPYIDADRIQARVQELGTAIQERYAGRQPVFVIVLKGAFVFAADLIRSCGIPCETLFVKVSSYEGMSSTGKVKVEMGGDQLTQLKGRDVIIVEDIVDSGKTLSVFIPQLKALAPRTLALASLLVKPEVMEYPIQVDFVGFEIPPAFVVGYGLDYDQLGRNLPAIYQLKP
jgi:hypoxanthine phosphoribosyltransferase